MDVRVSAGAQAHIDAAKARAVAKVTDEIAADARRMAPVDTGELQDSIESHPRAGRVTVGTDHWIYQEYGTRYQDGTAFMRPALYQRRRI